MKLTGFRSDATLKGLAVPVMWILMFSGLAGQGWYNTDWDYRIPVTISNGGSALTDFQVRVPLDNSFPWSHVNNNGSDIRITSSDGVTEYPAWIENWTYGSEADIWVRVPSVDAYPSTTLIYVYYGNEAAPAASDGDATFLFFDDFEGGVLDADKWHTVGSPAYSFVQDDGSTVISMTGTGTHLVYIASDDMSFDNFILEVNVKMTVDINNNCTPEIGFRLTNDNNKYISMLRGEGLIGGGGPNGDLFIRKYENGVQTNPTPYPAYNYTGNIYYRYRVDANLDTINQYLDDELIRSWEDTGTGILTGGICLLNFGGPTTNPVYFDDVRIRRYASTEPSVMRGPAENQYPPLVISGIVTDIQCYGDHEGSIDITVTGGDGTYIYSWSNGETTEDISGLAAGTYSVHVEDGNGPMGNASFTITQPDPFIAGYAVSVPYDCISGMATIQVTASGGTPPYSGTGSFVQSAGSTIYTVTDSNGCQSSVTVTVSPAASWLDPEWVYRKPVDVLNPGGTPLSDFQVKVFLDATFDFGKTNSGGSDIRFTEEDGVTQVPFWIESWDGTSGTGQATIWIRIPDVPASGTKVYMYYGNPGAISAGNGTATFRFFDDFSNPGSAPGRWIRRLTYSGGVWGPDYVSHDWKYCMEMQQGALYYSIERAAGFPAITSLDAEIEGEFDYIHSQINPDGTVTADSYLTSEPQYCYGTLMSNLALGYVYFRTSNPGLATRCYNDLVLVFNRLRVTYPTVTNLSDAGGYGMLLQGFSNAWLAFSTYGNSTMAGQASAIVQSYASTFLSNQSSGAWSGANGVQEHLKRDFGLLKAFDVTGNTSYLDAVSNNIDYILSTFWVEANGGLEWYANPASSDHFYECHQQWFMIAVRLLYNASGGTYDYLTQGQQAWHFMTDNNYAGIDMYVHNMVNHNAFFSYRQILQGGSIQSDSWKGSYEIGTALWGMALNYDWVSDYQSSHSAQSYNYLDEMARQLRNPPASSGYYVQTGYSVNSSLWTRVGSPSVNIVEDDGNNVVSIIGNNNHTDLIASVDNSFDNFVFEARVKMTADGNLLCNPVVDVRYTDPGNRYMTQLRGEAQNDMFMRKYQAGIQFDLATVPYNYEANRYYNLMIAVAGDHLETKLDGNTIISYTDPGTGVLSGGVSLRNYENNDAAYFDDVRIRSYASPEPESNVGTEEAPDQWTGAESNDWNNPANWLNGVPGPCSIVTLTSAPLNQPHITGQTECLNLSLSSGSGLTIDNTGALTVTGNMEIMGALNINSTLSSSGSLIVEGSSLGDITFNRQLKTGSVAGSDFHLVAPPVAGNSDANTGKINTVNQWSEVTGVWTATNITSALPGYGYNIRQEEASDGVISFTGPMVNADVSVEVSSPYADAVGPDDNYFERTFVAGRSLANPGGRGWNLLGNPYPSAIPVDDFITANNSSTPSLSQFDPNYVALYLFDGTARRYYYLANYTGWPSGLELNETHIQAGQGFFVLAMNDNSVFQFTRDMQQHSTGTAMLKSGSADDRWPGLQLKVAHSAGEVITTVVYGENMSAGVDPGYDVGLFKSGQAIEIFTTLALSDNGVNYARQALPSGGADTLRIPVGIDFKAGGEVTFSATTVPVGGRRFWLEDRTAGIFTDLSLKSYTVTLPAATYGTGRFFLQASANTPTGNNELTPEEDATLRIWAYDRRIIIKGEVTEGAVCEIFDTGGRKLLVIRLTGGELNTVDLPGGLHGVVVVRINDLPVVVSRKVALPW